MGDHTSAHAPRAPSAGADLQRQRSNSFPMVDALGCSTPEATLLLAEGRAAVRKRRARRKNRSVNDEHFTTYDPRQHMHYLNASTSSSTHTNSRHARIPSDTTDKSTSTVTPQTPRGKTHPDPSSPATPLGSYSANLAQFIKAQLNSIPTYQQQNMNDSPLSSTSCPEFSFPARAPSQLSERASRRLFQAPSIIEIPPIKPPLQSAFSAWSSTDDGSDDEASPVSCEKTSWTRRSDSPAVICPHEENSANFFFSLPSEDEEEVPDTARAAYFPNQSAFAGSDSEHLADSDADGYASSSYLSHPQLSTSSIRSLASSSASYASSSYFDYKAPMSFRPDIKERIVAALTPPVFYPGKGIPAISPWEGAALANVHEVFVESEQRVHVDGMSFDMLREFIHPAGVTTPC